MWKTKTTEEVNHHPLFQPSQGLRKLEHRRNPPGPVKQHLRFSARDRRTVLDIRKLGCPQHTHIPPLIELFSEHTCTQRSQRLAKQLLKTHGNNNLSGWPMPNTALRTRQKGKVNAAMETTTSNLNIWSWAYIWTEIKLFASQCLKC